MCIPSLHNNKSQQTYAPQNELQMLCIAAYEQYQLEIINDDKLYHRYVEDFVNSHMIIDSSNHNDWNIHFKNLCSIKSLLEQRKDLVLEYFSKPHLEMTDCNEMILSLNYGRSPKSKFLKAELGNLSDNQLQQITDFVNGDFENKKKKKGSIFAKAVSYDEMYDLFHCRLTNPIRTGSNVKFALFMDSLSTHNLLHYSYQELILEYQLILSSKDGVYYGGNAISASISIAKRGKSYIGNPYDSFVNELTKCSENAIKHTK